jgi:hypothetical protein
MVLHKVGDADIVQVKNESQVTKGSREEDALSVFSPISRKFLKSSSYSNEVVYEKKLSMKSTKPTSTSRSWRWRCRPGAQAEPTRRRWTWEPPSRGRAGGHQ